MKEMHFFYIVSQKLPYDQVCPSVGWTVGLPVIISQKGGQFHFHGPIGAVVHFHCSQLLFVFTSLAKCFDSWQRRASY